MCPLSSSVRSTSETLGWGQTLFSSPAGDRIDISHLMFLSTQPGGFPSHLARPGFLAGEEDGGWCPQSCLAPLPTFFAPASEGDSHVEGRASLVLTLTGCPGQGTWKVPSKGRGWTVCHLHPCPSERKPLPEWVSPPFSPDPAPGHCHLSPPVPPLPLCWFFPFFLQHLWISSVIKNKNKTPNSKSGKAETHLPAGS